MGVVIQGEPSNRVALFNTIKNTTSIQNESLHRPSMRRSRLRWRRHVRHEENAKNMGRTQGNGIMLRREHDEDILAQNEKGSCPMYNNPHRFVHALLEGAEDLKTMKMFKAMSVLG